MTSYVSGLLGGGREREGNLRGREELDLRWNPYWARKW